MNDLSHFDYLMNRKSFVEDSHLVCIHSAICTGTHLVKLILEESEFFNYSINEQKKDDDGRTLQDYLFMMLTRCISKVDFYERAIGQLTNDLEDLRIEQHSEYSEGIQKKDKNKIKYFLFHCHANYMTRAEIFLYPFHSFVIPVRHPILSIISMLRRHRRDLGVIGIERVIFEWMYCAKFIWSRDFPVYVFINPWEIVGFGRLFKRLKITMNQKLREIIEKPPIVNETLREENIGDKKHFIAIDHTQDGKLKDAKEDFLATGAISPPLKRYYAMAERSGLMKVYYQVCENNKAKASPI